MKRTWKQMEQLPAVRLALVVLGAVCVIASPIVGVFPGPLGLPLFVAGATLMLRYSEWVKRRYVRFKRAHPNKGRWADWSLRRASAKRREERLKAERQAAPVSVRD